MSSSELCFIVLEWQQFRSVAYWSAADSLDTLRILSCRSVCSSVCVCSSVHIVRLQWSSTQNIGMGMSFECVSLGGKADTGINVYIHGVLLVTQEGI